MKTGIIRSENGVTIIAVLFILAALGGMGVAVTKITENQQRQALTAIQVQDSYYAAQSGLEWSYQRAVELGLTGATLANLNGTYTLPNGTQYVLAYDPVADTMNSTAAAGDTERMLAFTAFTPSLPGGPPPGGGTACSATGYGLFENYVGTATRIIDGDGVLAAAGPTNVSASDPFSLPAFPPGNYQNVRVDDGVLNLTGDVYIKEFEAEGNSQITITGPATLYLTKDFKLKDRSSLVINGDVKIISSEDVRFEDRTNVTVNGNLLVQAGNKVQVKNNATVNSGQGSGNVLLAALSQVRVEDNSTVSGALYSTGDVKINTEGSGNIINFTGAIVAGDELLVNESGRRSAINMTYESTAGTNILSDPDFFALCPAA